MAWDDPRTLLVHGGIAAESLEGRVPAAAYRPVRRTAAVRGRAPVRQAQGPDAEQADEMVFGERFDILLEDGAYVFGQALRDGYVGWVEAAALAAEPPGPTHRVRALSTFAFSRPSIKAPPAERLPLNALISVEAQDGRFLKAFGSGWIVHEHLSPIGTFAEDPAQVALAFLGAPYLWGGRTVEGVDCSGLVQQALYACGYAAPRDTDQQAALGEPTTPGEGFSGLRRNDLVLWPGHIGVMVDPETLLHANAFTMCVSLEPLAAAVQRIGGPKPAFRRLDRV